MTTDAFMDSSARFRQALERRREKAAGEESLRKIPFVLDQDLADAVDRVAKQHAAAEDYLAALEADKADRDAGEDSGADVRASGHDLSELGQAIDAATAEVERLKTQLADAVEAARDVVVDLVFRRADAEGYERKLIEAGGAAAVETDTAAAVRFQNALTAHCFVRVEMSGEDAGVKSWKDFVSATGMTFGELDPIRSLVYAMNKRGGNSIPFLLAPSKQTTTS